MVHFNPSRMSGTACDIAPGAFTHIMIHHSFTDPIVSDCDPKCFSKHWSKLVRLGRLKLELSIAQHPRTDGASPVMNWVVENYICCYCEHKKTHWDLLLPLAEFTQSSPTSEDLGFSVQNSLGLVSTSPFGYTCRDSSLHSSCGGVPSLRNGRFRRRTSLTHIVRSSTVCWGWPPYYGTHLLQRWRSLHVRKI